MNHSAEKLTSWGWALLFFLIILGATPVPAQRGEVPEQPADSSQPELPAANPGRPTVSTPATLTPVGYLQFESGLLGAWHSPEFSSQSSVNEVVKFSIWRRLELLAGSGPFAHSRATDQAGNGTGDLSLGLQAVAHQGEGTRPTVALSYFRRVYSGNTPDLDIGSARNSLIVLASADVKGFHYDTNFMFNEVTDRTIRRAQFGQTLSISHPVGKKFGISGEIWHFTQPFLHSNAVGNLWSLNYNARKTLCSILGSIAGSPVRPRDGRSLPVLLTCCRISCFRTSTTAAPDSGISLKFLAPMQGVILSLRRIWRAANRYIDQRLH